MLAIISVSLSFLGDFQVDLLDGILHNLVKIVDFFNFMINFIKKKISQWLSFNFLIIQILTINFKLLYTYISNLINFFYKF